MTKVSEAIGVTSETARRVYLDKQRVANVAEVQRRMARFCSLRGPVVAIVGW
jgi:hypothetical protein